MPSLCTGWKVRHVVGHICLGSQISPLSMPLRIVPFGFNVAKASSVLSYRYGDEHTPEQLLETFDWLSTVPGKPGLAKVVPPAEFFVDKLIHDQDIRRPLDLAWVIPAHHLVALDAMLCIGGFLKSNRVAQGLRLVATDIDHTVGDGAEVRGPAEAIVLALGPPGRTPGPLRRRRHDPPRPHRRLTPFSATGVPVVSAVLDALAFYGLETTADPLVWLCVRGTRAVLRQGALFGGCGLGAADIQVLERVTGWPSS